MATENLGQVVPKVRGCIYACRNRLYTWVYEKFLMAVFEKRRRAF